MQSKHISSNTSNKQTSVQEQPVKAGYTVMHKIDTPHFMTITYDYLVHTFVYLKTGA